MAALLCQAAFSQATSPGIVDPVTGIPAAELGAHGHQFPSPGAIDPATGIPAPGRLTPLRSGQTAGPGTIDPGSGLPVSQPGERTPFGAVNAEAETAREVQGLIFNERYSEALQRCLAFHDKWRTSASLISVLPHWVELGRRYPEAKTALLNIRDNDIREFSEGRGYFALFQEVSAINGFLHQDESTYELFKSFRDTDPGLEQQCYPVAEGVCVAKGDYQWCYDHMGDPQAKFDSIHRFMKMLSDFQERDQARNQQIQAQLSAIHQQRGLTNMPAYSSPDTSAMRKKSIEDGFVGQTRQLIEILVATGHKPEAEKIRDKALAVLDDPRLKSAVDDVSQHVAQPARQG